MNYIKHYLSKGQLWYVYTKAPTVITQALIIKGLLGIIL